MEFPRKGSPKWCSGKGKKDYHGYHNLTLQLDIEDWTNPPFMNGRRKLSPTPPIKRTNRTLYEEHDSQVVLQSVVDSIRLDDCSFGSRAEVDIEGADESYWKCSAGEPFAHFLGRIKPDVVGVVSNSKVVIEMKPHWPLRHDLQRLTHGDELKLYGQLVQQMCAYRTRYGIVTNLKQTRFCRLIQGSGGWTFEKSRVVDYGDNGATLIPTFESFFGWLGQQVTDLTEAHSHWVTKEYVAKKDMPAIVTAVQINPTEVVYATKIETISQTEVSKKRSLSEDEPVAARKRMMVEPTVFKQKAQ